MAAEKSDASFERGNIRFTQDRVMELDRGHAVVRVSRGDIQRIALRWGFQAPRPLVQAVLGIGLLAVGCALLGLIIAELVTHGGRVVGRFLIGLVISGLLGIWLAMEAFRRGYYLEVTTKRGREKLRFDRGLSRHEIEDLLATVRAELGYEVAEDLPSGPDCSRSVEPV